MINEQATPTTGGDDVYPWLRDGSMPHSREDLVAEALALLALIFSVGIGLVIALLPVSATAVTPGSRIAVAAEPVAASLELQPSPRPRASSGR